MYPQKSGIRKNRNLKTKSPSMEEENGSFQIKDHPSEHPVEEWEKPKKRKITTHFDGRTLRKISKQMQGLNVSIFNRSDSSTHPSAMKNTLFRDRDYYMIYTPENYVIGVYYSTKALGYDTLDLSTAAYRTLNPERKGHVAWLDGEVIDCFAAVSSKSWENVMYIPSTLASFIVGHYYKQKKYPSSAIYTLNLPESGKVMIPYLYNNHWRLVVVDIDNKNIVVIDPLSRNNCQDESRAFKAIKGYFNIDGFKNQNTLYNMKLELGNPPKERPLQKDTFNCGVFVMHYMNSIGRNKIFDLNSIPAVFRRDVADVLLEMSENLKDVFQYCTNSEDSFTMVMCELCRRWVHTDCLKHKFKDNTDYTNKSVHYTCQACNEACNTGARDWMLKV